MDKKNVLFILQNGYRQVITHELARRDKMNSAWYPGVGFLPENFTPGYIAANFHALVCDLEEYPVAQIQLMQEISLQNPSTLLYVWSLFHPISILLTDIIEQNPLPENSQWFTIAHPLEDITYFDFANILETQLLEVPYPQQ